MKKLLTLCIFATFLIFSAASAQSLDFAQMAPHPRLMLRSGDITAMRVASATSASARKAHERIVASAEQVISREVVTHPLNITTQDIFEDIFYLSYSYLTTDDMRYARRAEQEMLAVCALPDWNPSSPEDVAKLTMALAIGYDWLYRALPVHSRSIIGTTIYEKGLRVAEELTMSESIGNIGMLFGALATADRSPEYCRMLIAKYVEANEQMLAKDSKSLTHIEEWSREAALQAMYSATMKAALGVNPSSSVVESFAEGAETLSYMVAPSLLYYNYGGSSAEANSIAAKYWAAMESGNTSLVAIDERLAVQGHFVDDFTLPLYMLFASGQELSKLRMPNEKLYRGADESVIYHSGWDANDTYLAIKGGDAASAGEYVFESRGVRWTSLTGDVDGRLVIDGVSGDGQGEGRVREVFEASRHHGAVIDLSSLYSAQATSVVRTVELGKGDRLVVTDNVSCGSQPASIEWSITTAAEAEVVATNTIKLTHMGQTLYLKVRSRAQTVAKIWPDEQGTRRVGFVLTANAGSDQTIEVTMSADNTKGFDWSRLLFWRR